MFGKFKEGPAYGRERNYTCETTAQNLWGKKIDAVFSLYLFDKSNVRIGEGCKFPLEIGPDDVSGGSVSYELGTLSRDTVEFRDGSVLVCDVESMSATEVVIRIGGALERMDRNKIKRMLLVERDPPSP